MMRLGFGASILLISAFIQLSVADHVPVTTMKGINVFIGIADLSFLFATFALLESAFVLMLSFKQDQHLMPEWLQRRVAILLLKIKIDTTYGAGSDVGTVKSNAALQEWLEEHQSVTQNPMATKRRRTRTLKEVVESGENLDFHKQAASTAVSKKFGKNGIKDASKKNLQDELAELQRVHRPDTFGESYVDEGKKSMATPEPGESLDAWLTRVGYAAYIESFRAAEINTLIKLAEIGITEADLIQDLKMIEILPRRRLICHIRALDGRKDEEEKLDTVLQQLQDGLVGHATQRKPASPATNDGTSECENVALLEGTAGGFDDLEKSVRKPESEIFNEYWLWWAKRVDKVAQLLMPVAYAAMVYLDLSPHLDVILG